ncbi:hypothetical protein [Rhodanobacter sp. MP1X3]|uniref:hypothetical protein n=1 Tax=Rhodanobacter sp. MP1X3 TaxID=2723086 RepID=UPI00161863EB|nr:hypothetical protein [Rhodanobacter sp. MP1X3]MBB6241577.1 putative membrane protein [Rhodanobacter sp. MP1X3]
MLIIALCIAIVLFLALLVIAVRAFAALRRESSVRREFGQSSLLDGLVLLYPLGPLCLLIGRRFMPIPLAFLFVAAFFLSTLLVASKQRNALERAGTDRVSRALEATSFATLEAIVGIIYLVLAGMFVLLTQALSSQELGA